MFRVAALLGIVSLCSACSSSPADPNRKAVQPAVSAALAAGIQKEANAYRKSMGKSGLSRHAGLDQLAQRHSEDMLARNKRDHNGFGYRSDESAARYGMGSVAENVLDWHGKSAPSASAMMRVWIDSSGHRKNLLGEWNATGIGVARDGKGGTWATQIFAAKTGPGPRGSVPAGNPTAW
ncbi:CAP domain-containing protein [Luteolibacter sp. Populi]|uniref:CAP domain-containing protein n=1 Tax=Luteolibacter sp. Populi TaxID=3230487 RepID=UPI003467D8D5